MKPCVLNQLNVINCHCTIVLYITATCVVSVDCVLASCHTYIMQNTIKTRYDLTFNSFMEWHFCTISVYYNNFESNLSESHRSKSPCCVVLKNMSQITHHYHKQIYEQKRTFSIKFFNNQQETYALQ